MADPTYDWSEITGGEIDADSPFTETLMRKIREDLIHLREVLYDPDSGFVPQKGHTHNGSDSAAVVLDDNQVTTNIIQDGAVTQDKLEDYQAGDYVRAESLAETEHALYQQWYKVKEIQIDRPGTLRLTWQHKGSLMYGQIWKNGSPYGTAHYWSNSVTWASLSEDLSGWVYGDLVQLWLYGSWPSVPVWSKNFRIRIHRLIEPLVIS